MYFEKKIKRNPCVLERCLQTKEIQKEREFYVFHKTCFEKCNTELKM